MPAQAGLVVGCMLVPQAMAYAAVAGLPGDSNLPNRIPCADLTQPIGGSANGIVHRLHASDPVLLPGHLPSGADRRACAAIALSGGGAISPRASEPALPARRLARRLART